MKRKICKTGKIPIKSGISGNPYGWRMVARSDCDIVGHAAVFANPCVVGYAMGWKIGSLADVAVSDDTVIGHAIIPFVSAIVTQNMFAETNMTFRYGTPFVVLSLEPSPDSVSQLLHIRRVFSTSLTFCVCMIWTIRSHDGGHILICLD